MSIQLGLCFCIWSLYDAKNEMKKLSDMGMAYRISFTFFVYYVEFVPQ